MQSCWFLECSSCMNLIRAPASSSAAAAAESLAQFKTSNVELCQMVLHFSIQGKCAVSRRAELFPQIPTFPHLVCGHYFSPISCYLVSWFHLILSFFIWSIREPGRVRRMNIKEALQCSVVHWFCLHDDITEYKQGQWRPKTLHLEQTLLPHLPHTPHHLKERYFSLLGIICDAK